VRHQLVCCNLARAVYLRQVQRGYGSVDACLECPVYARRKTLLAWSDVECVYACHGTSETLGLIHCSLDPQLQNPLFLRDPSLDSKFHPERSSIPLLTAVAKQAQNNSKRSNTMHPKNTIRLRDSFLGYSTNILVKRGHFVDESGRASTTIALCA